MEDSAKVKRIGFSIVLTLIVIEVFIFSGMQGDKNLGVWIYSIALYSPALLFSFSKYPSSWISAACTQGLFIVWQIYYGYGGHIISGSGSGDAIAFGVIPLWGIPLSIIMGLVARAVSKNSKIENDAA